MQLGTRGLTADLVCRAGGEVFVCGVVVGDELRSVNLFLSHREILWKFWIWKIPMLF